MKKYFFHLLFLIAISLLAYHYSLISFLLMLCIALSLLVLIVAGIIKLLSSSLNPIWLKLPFQIILICIVGIFIGLFRPLAPAVIHTDDVSENLSYAYQTDQGDRKNLKAYIGLFREELANRDSLRLRQVKDLYTNRLIQKPLDKFHAAFVFHHAEESKDYEIANELASQAASAEALKDVYQVQWLAKASYDRWMVSLGKPQKYDTQDKFGISVE
ncbi:hypothetical protein OKW21_002988 [Catalinimonas alkaloidigena]|uniref:hypothetical protein n=1 Tax=Catalinimonas alkaloidigena TaxID=1075417 RepID=UPI002407719D|nr:hypothetical protein [Catalinimonas alkaloidigena]MDF9797725.1 hypothetical protein [Catalinimonas alkaloidigena]